MNKTIVVDVDENQKRTCIVRFGEYLTLVILAHSPKQKESRISIRLIGRGAHATIIGLIMGNNSNNFLLHTMQIHEAPETSSDLLVKSVLTDHAKFYYDGEIRVEKNAQKTNAYQRNENLLLSEESFARSDPSLEILANDVRCTHGATVGKISDEELWYLSSRGISESTGKKLIVEGFLESAIARISDSAVAQNVREKLWKSL